MAAIRFEKLRQDPDSRARAGELETPHGVIATPAFAPVATRGAVKALTPQALSDLAVGVVMANAYHLAVRPGAAAVASLGGLHAFSAWQGPIMTDSGGYQVFSLAPQRRVDDDGVTFRDALDGSGRRLTPESVIAVQESLGADIVFPLDVCTALGADRRHATEDLERTQAWAVRSVAARRRGDQGLMGIVQGSVYPELRRQGARAMAALDVDGFAIGGVSVGEGKTAMYAAVDAVVDELPDGAPRHLLGVGHGDDLIEAVARGIDTFDCVMPTRVARNGAALTGTGRINLRGAEYAQDRRPIEAGCPCYACQHFTRGAIRHWLKAGEILPLTLLSIHNLHHVLDILSRARAAILTGTFTAFRVTPPTNPNAAGGT